LCICM